MARFSCPQCGRRFGSVGEVLNHTQQVHADDPPTTLGAETAAPSRSMPSAEPGPVATERASEAGFETEPAGRNGPGAPGPGPRRPEGEEEKESPNFGTLIALVVIAIIIILNIIGGGGGE